MSTVTPTRIAEPLADAVSMIKTHNATVAVEVNHWPIRVSVDPCSGTGLIERWTGNEWTEEGHTNATNGVNEAVSESIAWIVRLADATGSQPERIDSLLIRF